MKIYVTPAGNTALKVDNFLDRAREEFGFDLAFLLTDADRAVKMYNKLFRDNVIIIPLPDPVLGMSDYIPTIRRIVRKIVQMCDEPELIILNSSGGTEKMTNIIKDVGSILETYFNVMRVWGVYDTILKDVVFSVKPVLDYEAEMSSALEDIASIRKELCYDHSVDVNEVQRFN